MEINYKDLFIQILTQEDIDELSERIDFLLHSTYKMEKDIQEVELELPLKYAKTIESYFTVTKRNRYDPIEFTNGLKDMIKILDGLEKAIITIAIEPNYKLIHDISSWFYHNVDKKIILKIKVDSNLVAGMTIYYTGEFMDYSYAELFTEKLGELNGNI